MLIYAFALLLCLPVAMYLAWQIGNYLTWRDYHGKPTSTSTDPVKSLAVLIPYRNEAANLPGLIESLKVLDLSDLQVTAFLINDHSEDDGSAIASNKLGEAAGAKGVERSQATSGNFLPNGLTVELLDLSDELGQLDVVAMKKAALTLGIQRADAEVIVTIDADCTLPDDLLQNISKAFHKRTQAVMGPVLIAPAKNVLTGFQALDLAAYQFLTAVSVYRNQPTLANGACFAFRKQAFIDVDGYAGMRHLPSGDDVLLLHKFVQHYPPTVFNWVSSQAAVLTQPVLTWRKLWNQRLRWAGKAGEYQSSKLEFAQALTFATCFSLLALIPLSLHLRSVALLIIPWLAKVIVDFLCLRTTLKQYGRGSDMRYYLAAVFIYPPFLLAVGSAALLGFNSSWKGRPTTDA